MNILIRFLKWNLNLLFNFVSRLLQFHWLILELLCNYLLQVAKVVDDILVEQGLFVSLSDHCS